MQVSIPHRKAKNLLEEIADKLFFIEFQFLIGKLKTQRSTSACHCPNVVSIPHRKAKNLFDPEGAQEGETSGDIALWYEDRHIYVAYERSWLSAARGGPGQWFVAPRLLLNALASGRTRDKPRRGLKR